MARLKECPDTKHIEAGAAQRRAILRNLRRPNFAKSYCNAVNETHCCAFGGVVLLPVFASQRMTLSSLEQNVRTPDWL